MEKNNYLISEMKIEDLENIKDILEVDFDEFWNYETLKEELARSSASYRVPHSDILMALSHMARC